MSRLAASFVLGYHGCDVDVAARLVNRTDVLKPSNKKYDWLGSGIYFWGSDPHRAREWANEARARGRIKNPAVIGAVIDLGNCLDLLNRENIELVRQAHALRFDRDQDIALSPAEASAAAEEFKSIADSDGDGRITPIEYRQARDFILARY